MKKLLFIVLLATTNVLNAQNYNLSFEAWEGSFNVPINDSCTLPLNPAVNSSGDRLPQWSANPGVLRTTDAHSGNYAAVVCMWYYARTGILGLGQDSTEDIICKNYFPQKLYGISGYYKYLTDSFAPNDIHNKNAIGHIRTYKINPANNMLEVLTHDSLVFTKSNAYAPYQIIINYPDSLSSPDSISVWFESKNNDLTNVTCSYAHFLYLDDLNFHFSPMSVGARKPALKKKVNIYPSPANGTVYLSYDNELRVEGMWLSDLSGRKIKTFDPQAKSLAVKPYPAGIYLLHIQSVQGHIIKKIVLQ
ncbi:MAG: T9SS type A sorting domain-containing protein [Taibaiella sp.]|nr:T9SS type A sorting domain-containing protein [Taibaiella sp.]